MSVLLLEAGGWDTDPWIKIPLGWGKIFAERRHDWMYFTEPEPTLEGRSIECARGKVIGGSSSINAMAYVRGHRNDYDRWAANGLPEWSYAHVLPYFKRQETWEGGADRYRGGDGPLATCRARYADPLVEAYLQAGQDAGYPLNPDYNGATQEGVGYMQSTIRHGRRCSAADAYLRPALQRKNLTVQTNAHATGLSFSGARATGVQFSSRSGTQAVKARREIIVAGGAINTPQLLMLSGVGDPDELASHGIAVKTPLRGVGKNLRDHFSAAIEYERKRTRPVCGQYAARPYLGRARQGLFSRHRICHRSAERLDRIHQERGGKAAAGYPVPVPGGPGGGGALSAAVQRSLYRRLRLPRRPGAAGKRGLCASGVAGSACAHAHLSSVRSPPTPIFVRCVKACEWPMRWARENRLRHSSVRYGLR